MNAKIVFVMQDSPCSRLQVSTTQKMQSVSSVRQESGDQNTFFFLRQTSLAVRWSERKRETQLGAQLDNADVKRLTTRALESELLCGPRGLTRRLQSSLSLCPQVLNWMPGPLNQYFFLPKVQRCSPKGSVERKHTQENS